MNETKCDGSGNCSLSGSWKQKYIRISVRKEKDRSLVTKCMLLPGGP
jgi:hypothetical protein